MSVEVRVSPDGKYELEGELPPSALYNRDLARTPIRLRGWGLYSYLALWIGTAVVIPSWSLANVGLVFGFDWLTAVVTVILGNAIVTVPLLLNSHVGAKYGIPFPVFVRASFGTFGANVAALMRGIVVACGWFGIETWLGGFAMYTLLFVVLLGSPDPPGPVGLFVLPGPRQMLMFAVFWVLQVWLAIVAPPWKGSRAIKTMFDWSAPFLLAFTTFLFLYEGFRVGFDKLFSVQLQPDKPLAGTFYFWWLLLNINVGFWATMALNIPDVTRFAKNQSRQMIGQAIGLIGTMGYFSLMGVLVTQGGTVLFPQTARDTANQAGTANDIWNPVNLFALLANELGVVLVVVALIFVVLAQLSTNIGANIIAPANDFQNVYPKTLNWTWGVIITGVIGVLLQPWHLFFNALNYAIVWLSGYGGFLGAIGGIMVADYWLLRNRWLKLDDLYRASGIYRYGNSWGINWSAIIALLVGIIPPFLGWLHVILSTPPTPGGQPFLPGGLFANYQGSALDWIQVGSWFFSFPVALLVYYALMKTVGAKHLEAQRGEPGGAMPAPQPAPLHPGPHRLALQEEQQVVGTAGFGVGAAHVEAAKGMNAHDRAGALAVQVQVADVEVALGPLEPGGFAAV